MDYFSTSDFGRLFTLRLDKGDFLLESIRALIEKENIKNAVVISGLGTFDSCVMHMVMTTGFPIVEHFERWEDKPLELSSIDGIIADGKPHLHMVVSDHEKAYSGHLEEGCRILYLGEVVILEVKNIELYRELNAQGINELKNRN